MAKDENLIVGRMLIGGAFVESEGGGWIDTINPANERLIGRVPDGNAAMYARADSEAASNGPEGLGERIDIGPTARTS